MDRHSKEYLERAEQRHLLSNLGEKDYREYKWAEDILQKINKQGFTYYQDFYDLDKAREIGQRLQYKYAKKPALGETRENHTTTHYIWRTQDDNKVRSRHAEFDDKIFSWDEPPAGGKHPGEDYGCRCWAEPYKLGVDSNNTTSQSNLSISDVGIEMIKAFEGFIEHVYLDIGGKATIGYGHLLSLGESFPMGISKAEAEVLLRQDLSVAENAVNNQVTVDLTQPQFDALVSFTFNVGQGNLCISDVLLHVNKREFNKAAKAFFHFTRAGSNPLALTNRRTVESSLFLSGSPVEK